MPVDTLHGVGPRIKDVAHRHTVQEKVLRAIGRIFISPIFAGNKGVCSAYRASWVTLYDMVRLGTYTKLGPEIARISTPTDHDPAKSRNVTFLTFKPIDRRFCSPPFFTYLFRYTRDQRTYKAF